MPTIPREYQELGEFIRKTRRGLRASQKEVATLTGVTDSYICQVERGKTRASDAFIRRLESALELRTDSLLLKLGKPSLDLLKTFLQPNPVNDDLLASISQSERAELISYLSFLRVQAQLRQLQQHL